MFLRFLHRLLEIFLHVERRFEQPFLRPALDAALRMPIAVFVTRIQNSLRSREDIGLAEETPLPGEDEAVQTMIDEMRRHLMRDFPRGGFERAGNTKTHGLVRGELVIHEGLPDKLRKGLFATPATYRCWVRFSGPGPHIEPDMNDVGFGSISVKVMGVPGEKLWDDEKHTQDFTSVCTPTFVTPDVKANARLQYWSRRHLPVFYFFDPREPRLIDFIMQGLWNETQTNPLGQTYYSCVPYLIGSGQAMQYSFWPMTKVSKRIAGLPFWVARQLSARQYGEDAGRDGRRVRVTRPVADRPVPYAHRKQRGHVADQAIRRAFPLQRCASRSRHSTTRISSPLRVTCVSIPGIVCPTTVRSATRVGRASACTTRWRPSGRR